MKILQQDGTTCTPDLLNVRGLRIKELTLDARDIRELCGMCAHPVDLINFIELLQICIWVPPPKDLRIAGMPIDVENFKLMQAGENYIYHTE